MNNEAVFIAFRAICNFINDLESVYGLKYKQLRLYHRLINQTQIGHIEAINKHVSIFREFCLTNREAIYEKDSTKLKASSTVSYSNKVYINFNHMFDIAEPDTKPIIWRHLLTISALLDPAGNAKNILKESKVETDSNETDFLTDMISAIETKIDPNATPVEAMTTMLQSGVVTDLLSSMNGSMKEGKLDMSKLLGAVGKMVGKLESQTGEDEGSKKMFNMVNGIIGSMENGEQPDIGTMMSMLTSTMANPAFKK